MLNIVKNPVTYNVTFPALFIKPNGSLYYFRDDSNGFLIGEPQSGDNYGASSTNGMSAFNGVVSLEQVLD